MCNFGSQTTTSTQTPSPTALNAYNTAFGYLQGAAAQPYTPYWNNPVAPLNQQQYAGINNVNSFAQAAQPGLQQAQWQAGAASAPLSAAAIQQYMSPYTQNVVNATQAQFANQNAQQQKQLTGNAIANGSFGGNNVGIQRAALANQQQLAQAPTIANLYNTGYNTALGTAMGEQNIGLSGAALGSQIAMNQQMAGLQGANAQFQMGSAEQQNQQALNNWIMQNTYTNPQAYPFQVANFLTSGTAGLGPLYGGQTQTSTPINPLAYLGLGVAGAGAFGQAGGFGALGGLFAAKDGGAIERDVGGPAMDPTVGLGAAVSAVPYGVSGVPYAGISGPSSFAGDNTNTAYKGYMPTSSNIPRANPQFPQAPSQSQTASNPFGLGNLNQQMQQIGALGKQIGNSSLGDAIADYSQDNFGSGATDAAYGISDAWRGGTVRGYAGGGGPDDDNSFASRWPTDESNLAFAGPPDGVSAAAPPAASPLTDVPLPRPRPTGPSGATVPDANGNEIVDRSGGVPQQNAGLAAAAVVAPQTGLTARDRDRVIKTVYGEAGNQAPIGQVAVAQVIRNRMGKGYGNTASDVVLAPYQFEPWNNQEGRSRMNTMPPEMYNRIGALVDHVFAGDLEDPTHGATHFYSPGSQHALGRADPSWARGQQALRIGDHLFYNLGEHGPGGAGGVQMASAREDGDESGLKNVYADASQEPGVNPEKKVTRTPGVAAANGNFWDRIKSNIDTSKDSKLWPFLMRLGAGMAAEPTRAGPYGIGHGLQEAMAGKLSDEQVAQHVAALNRQIANTDFNQKEKLKADERADRRDEINQNRFDLQQKKLDAAEWEIRQDEDGKPYRYNHVTGESQPLQSPPDKAPQATPLQPQPPPPPQRPAPPSATPPNTVPAQPPTATPPATPVQPTPPTTAPEGYTVVAQAEVPTATDAPPIYRNTDPQDGSLSEGQPFQYSRGVPRNIQKGDLVPAPKPVMSADGAYTYGSDAIRNLAEDYLLRGQTALPKVGNAKGTTAEKVLRAAVENYAGALARSRGQEAYDLARQHMYAPQLAQAIIRGPGQQASSIGTATQHLELVRDYAKAWHAVIDKGPGEGRLQLVNGLRARLATAIGKPEAATSQALGSVVAPEILKAIGVAGAGGEHERENLASVFDPKTSLSQANKIIDGMERLMFGQMQTKERQFTLLGMPPEDFKKLVGPEQYDKIKSLGTSPEAPEAVSQKAAPTDHDREIAKRDPKYRERFIKHFGVEP